ncbi:cytochrome P450 [Thelephora ganbajun]|uniref:Cytochrome P450 n=1 Tax=Thelephora ganbajun TaxID=370292 RepID=A0ACB6ZBJ5_THEGA|nr:cytochrome P450 [Thelephora ganbajun]
MSIDLMGADWTLGFMPYGNRWRTNRRLFHRFFNISAVERLDPRLFRGIRGFLRRLAESPEDFADHTRLLGGSLILSIVYGIEVDSQENQFFANAQQATYSLGPALLPGTFLVDWIPSLKYLPSWLPGAGFHAVAKRARRKLDEMKNLPFDHVKDNMKSGSSYSPSIASTCLEELDELKTQGVDEGTIRDLSAGVYVGGADTPPVVLQDFILAMVLHPHVLKKAQEEIDQLLGGERLPQYSDRPNLPYVSAVFKEIVRWRPPTPLSIPHRSMQDDVYEGYFIPAGTAVIENVWAMSRDESIYPDPETFNPERFIKDGHINPEVQDPEKFMSGHGRRYVSQRFAVDRHRPISPPATRFLMHVFLVSFIAFALESISQPE